jgi:signal transduction histidine kinase
MLRRLAGCLAHHVNNALTGVIGHLELGLRSVSPRSPAAEHLQTSLACAFQAAAAVKRIVAFACRPEPPQARGPLSLQAVAEELADQLRTPHRSGLTIVVVADSAGWMLANETILGAILEPVLVNALEAMPAGGTLRLHVYEQHGHSFLSVSDSGSGMPAEVLARLFEPFHTTKGSGHLGLGLVLCRDMAQLLGGRLDVASCPGLGTTVTLALPCPVAAELPSLPEVSAEMDLPAALEPCVAAGYSI